MRSIVLFRAGEGKVRPALVLTAEAKRLVLNATTLAPITSTVRGIASEVPVGPAEGLDHDSVVSLDSIITVPNGVLGREIGLLHPRREPELADAIVAAFDL